MSLETFAKILETETQKIDNWFAFHETSLPILPYFSCDVRHAHYKMAVVDTNLFPAGFNNLCSVFAHEVPKALTQTLSKIKPNVKKIGLLAEANTRHIYYLKNIQVLAQMLTAAGFLVAVTMPLDHFQSKILDLKLANKTLLAVHEPWVENGTLILGHDFVPDLILSNFDFSKGVPPPFDTFLQLITPHPHLGWFKRSKFTHFDYLTQLVIDFCSHFALDPWLLHAQTAVIELSSTQDLTPLAHKIDAMILELTQKHLQYNITDDPYIYVKNDSGTLGLGVIDVKNGADILNLNRKRRDKLFSGKTDKLKFILQEGVPTADHYKNAVIEPVIYGIGAKPVGGFFRIHEGKNKFESLNASGMEFSCLCLHKLSEPHEVEFIDCKCKGHVVELANFMARLAGLAARLEAKNII